MTTEQQHRAIRLVVILLVASVTASVVFALLTLLFRHDVLAYQQARDPSADPAALAATLWTRPIPILLVAVLYAGVARQLLAGRPRAYRRVRIVSVLGFAAVSWLLLSAAYPSWLRTVQAVQLGLLAALIAAANRPSVRAAFAATAAGAAPDPRPRNRWAAFTLLLLAPVSAEVSLGSVPLRDAWVWLIAIPIYGAGALFVRELVRRTGGGVAGLLLLGVAYGLVEEGLALQSLTSPHLYGAAAWAPRLFGFNTAYTELNLAYHAVFSVTIPAVLVELLFHRHGRSAYLRRGGLIATGVIALLGAALLRVSIPPAEDPGYTMPTTAILVVLTAIAAVTLAGLRLRVRPPKALAPPRASLVAATTALAVLGFLGLVRPFAGARGPMFTHGAWAFVPMAGAAAIAVAALLALRRWTTSPAWTSGHCYAACFGALTAHTCFGLVTNADTVADRLFLLAVAVLTVSAGCLLARRPPGGTATTPPNLRRRHAGTTP